ncbi:MAG: acyl-CoA/acyl-ACP dehydrogenase [Acidimicrobiales bacterium]|nr:acyl-CoA/acyl-ACP dehydrogenase [Acidimicrobiales bacterium]
MTPRDVVATATVLADDVLLPAALDTDVSDVLPAANLDALAAAGLFGVFASPDVGGLGVAEELPTIVEVLASGCLTTTLVWVQHFGLLGSLLAPGPLSDAWLADACAGRRRGGIAFGGLLPGPPVLTAAPHPDGWVLDGFAPWVSGWGRIDTLHVAARGPDETIVNVAIDAVEGDGVAATRRRLAAVDASATVRVDLAGVVVPEERVLGVAPYDPEGSLGARLRLNGSLALGVARRCCALMGPGPLDAVLDARRAELDSAGDEGMAAARAAASAFAVQAASALVAHTGSRSVALDDHAQRLAREAMFLLVFGSRPGIRSELLARLTAP